MAVTATLFLALNFLGGQTWLVHGFCSQQSQTFSRVTNCDARSKSRQQELISRFASAPRRSVVAPSTKTDRLSWDERLEQLKQFHKEHGHSRVTNNLIRNKPRFKGLWVWVKEQRRVYGEMRPDPPSVIAAQRIKSLEKLDFCWDVKQQMWENRFLELVQYKDQHGDTIVPKKEGSLGRWVVQQRSNYRKNVLSKEHMRRLDSIGFVWDPKERQFQKRLEELRAYKKKNGHVRVPYSHGELGSWFHIERKIYLKCLNGNSTILSNERRLALEDVGFGPNLATRREDDGVPATPISRLSWEERFEQLLGYKKRNGHVRVPLNDGTLGTWVGAQRRRKSSMSKERRKKLDEIGFIWNMNDWRWDVQLEALEEFKGYHGHTNVPLSEGELGQWVMKQRTEYMLLKAGERSSLTADRFDRLLSLQFCFDRGSQIKIENDNRWYLKLQELKKWKEKHGNYRVPQNQGALGEWAHYQRFCYRNKLSGNASFLTPDREAELEAIGFFDEVDLR